MMSQKKGGTRMFCTVCGRNLECELSTLDEYGKLELYHCYDCDTLFTLRDETISYIKNATKILNQVAEDIELNRNLFL